MAEHTASPTAAWPFTFADEGGYLALWCDQCEESVKSFIEAGDRLEPILDAAREHRCPA